MYGYVWLFMGMYVYLSVCMYVHVDMVDHSNNAMSPGVGLIKKKYFELFERKNKFPLFIFIV